MRAVVFVADDLGITAGVNQGIAEAAASGLVREASLCVTGNAVADGVRIARELGIGIGLHLSLTLGTALTGPIRGLTDAHGRFRSLPRALLATALRLVDRAAVAREVQAQIARAHELVGPLSHVNGHHHVHTLPIVRDVAFAAMRDAAVRWTRLPREHAAAGRAWSPEALLLAAFSRASAPRVREHGLRTLPFVGITTEACTDFGARAARLCTRLPAAPIEWMVHPRRADRDLAAIDPVGYRRPAEAELAWLADPQTASRHGLRPLCYAELE